MTDVLNTKSLIINPLVRLVPRRYLQNQAYRLGEKCPPGFEGASPTWEVFPVNLAARATQQMKVTLRHEFAVLALSASSSQAAGFAYQIYDIGARFKLNDRPQNSLVACGASGVGFYLREPYMFLDIDQTEHAQAYVIVKNLATAQNNIQLVLYGLSRRWNE